MAWLLMALDGAVFVLGTPLGLAVLLATFLLLARVGTGLPVWQGVVVVAAASGARWVPATVDANLVVPALLMLLGLLLAANIRLEHSAGAYGAAAVGGLATGLGGGMQVAAWPETAGAALVYMVLLAAAALLFARAPHVPRWARGATVARRMAGAWIAAVGSLMLALWLRGAGS